MQFFYLESPRVCGCRLTGTWHCADGLHISLHDLDNQGALLWKGSFEAICGLGDDGRIFAAVEGQGDSLTVIGDKGQRMTSKLDFEAKKMALLRDDLLLILAADKETGAGAAYAAQLKAKCRPEFVQIESDLPQALCRRSRIDVVDDYGLISQDRGAFCNNCDFFHSCAMLLTLKIPEVTNLAMLQAIDPVKLNCNNVQHSLCFHDRFKRYQE